MTLVFNPIGSNTFAFSEDQYRLATVQIQLWSAGIDLLADAKIESDLSENDFTTYNTYSNCELGIELKLCVSRHEPGYIQIESVVENNSQKVIQLDRITQPIVTLDPVQFPVTNKIWSMQGAAVAWGQDFSFEMPIPFDRENYLGHLQDAEGGGIPVNYFWVPGFGLALMHLEPEPQEWYMPVWANETGVTTSFELRRKVIIEAGQAIQLPKVVISVHRGDFFEPVALYSKLMVQRKQVPARPTPACFEPGWCSWGYEFDVTSSQVLGVLPVLDELNIKWLTLDDRWFDAYGDWNPRKDTFPGGTDEMRKMNDAIHQAGKFNQIWWYPLCAEDGHGKWESHTYAESRILQDHPDWVVLDEYGKVARNNRHLAMLCPALPEVQEYTRKLVETFIKDWGFDGHKLDNIYTMPACHNPAHHHTRPEESIVGFGEVYKMIFDLTRQLKPNSVTQICPCGTPITHNLLSAVDQTVTADPTSSAQIRQRIKFYKALMGPGAAVFADHVELSDGSCDFASEIGVGGVPATKFVFPDDEGLKATLQEYWNFPPEKKNVWKCWLDLYNRYRPAEGEYLNMYDTALEYPEGHATRKEGKMFYGFYASEFHGELELRGLTKGNYQVIDYVKGQEIGWVASDKPTIQISFKQSVLLVAIPGHQPEKE